MEGQTKKINICIENLLLYLNEWWTKTKRTKTTLTTTSTKQTNVQEDRSIGLAEKSGEQNTKSSIMSTHIIYFNYSHTKLNYRSEMIFLINVHLINKREEKN